MRASHQRTPGSLPIHAMPACMASQTHSSRKIHSAARTVNAPRTTAAGRLLRFPFMRADGAGVFSRPDDLVQLHALDVGVDLHPQRKVIGHLEGKGGLFHAREQVVQAPGIEIDAPRLVRKILRIPGAVQDLIVALVLGEVRAEGLALEGGGHLKPFPGQGRELLRRFDVEVPDDDEVLVLGGLFLSLQVDPSARDCSSTSRPAGVPHCACAASSTKSKLPALNEAMNGSRHQLNLGRYRFPTFSRGGLAVAANPLNATALLS